MAVVDEMRVLEAGPAATAMHTSRMAVAVLALVGVFISSYMMLHKLGVIGTLTCTVGDCATVQLSPYAVFLGVPVPALGIVGYTLILAVAMIGVQGGPRWVAPALLVLGAGGFGFSMYLTALEAFVIRAWCQWCVGSAIVATLIFFLSLAELPRLRRRSSDG